MSAASRASHARTCAGEGSTASADPCDAPTWIERPFISRTAAKPYSSVTSSPTKTGMRLAKGGAIISWAMARPIGLAELPENQGFNTLAGFILWQLGRVPKATDRFEWHGWRFEVVDMDGRRIDKVVIHPPQSAESAS